MRKRVRFEVVKVGQICETEYREKVMKVEEVSIYTDEKINFRNAVNLFTGKLMPISDHQWVWIDEVETPHHTFPL